MQPQKSQKLKMKFNHFKVRKKRDVTICNYMDF